MPTNVKMQTVVGIFGNLTFMSRINRLLAHLILQNGEFLDIFYTYEYLKLKIFYNIGI